MKLKLTVVLLMLIIISGCNQMTNLIKPKPVEIDGLGSLQSVKDKQFDENQLRILFDGLSKQNKVNQTDAEALLNIYKNNSKEFLRFSGGSIDSEKVVKFLSLILQYENLREETRLVTNQTMAEQIQSAVDFKADLPPQVSDLSGNYLVAALKSIAKNDAETRSELIRRQQTANSLVTVQGYEAKAFELSVDKETPTEQKKNAGKLISDLRAYNESLSADGKILDANGRLINPSQMIGTQRQNLEKIFSGDENLARRGLAERMDAMRDKLNNGIEQKLH